MSTTVEALEAEALQFPPAERAWLVERLIAGFDSDPEVEEAWVAGVERRHAEVESGAVSLLPGPETLAKLRAEFRS
jgi:putative addiction module component